MRALYLQINKEIIKKKALTANVIGTSNANKVPHDVNQQKINNNFNAENSSLTEAFNYGKTITFDPSKTSFSQATVSFEKNERSYNYETMVESMKAKGWNGDPVDVVIMPNGTATSMDNTRILAAREAGIDVQARVRDYNSPLTLEESRRFKENGVTPSTWGEVIKLRVEKQGTQKGVPTDWPAQFPYGSLYDPKIIK